MTSLSPDKLAEVAALLEKTSPELAARLVALFERVKVKGDPSIPSDALLKAVRESGIGLPQHMTRLPGFDRLFYEPFESLFQSPVPDARHLPGSLPRAGLKTVWELLTTEIAAEAHARLDPLVRAAILRGANQVARGHACEFRAALAAAFRQPQTLERWTDLIRRSGEDAGPQSVAARMPALLMAEHAARSDLAQVAGAGRDLPDGLVRGLGETLREVEADSAAAALELVLLAMSRCARPWQVLRVLTVASRDVTDRKLALTEFQLIGDRLIAMGGADFDLFAAAAAGQPFDPGTLVTAVEQFGNLVAGFLRQDVLSPDGPWRRDLQKLQSDASERLEAVCRRAATLTEQALPVDRVRLKNVGLVDRPRTHQELRMDRVEQLPGYYTFLRDVRLFAGAAGFSGARERAVREIDQHLNTVRDALLAARGADGRGAAFDQWVRVMAQLVEAFESGDAARTFERRMAA